jgi:superfamily II DNA helicase RecQ
MQDQVSGMQDKGISAAYLSSALTTKQRQAVLQQLSSYSQQHQAPRLQLLYVTPELLDASDRCVQDPEQQAIA